jgi:uncharacterized membrane protein HdeD (DUF308 family)
MRVVRTEPTPRPPSTRSAPYLCGLGVTLLGTVALVAAATGSLAAVPVVGLVLAVAGTLDAAGSRRARPTGRFLGDALGGLLSVAAGLSILAAPRLGLRAAALVLGAYLIASAVVRGYAAAASRHVVWAFPVVYAAVAGILGLVVLASGNLATPLLLGAVAGLEIGARGIVLMAVALELRRLDRTPA